MIISVRIKLFLNIFNYKVIFQCFHYFLFENKLGWKIFFNYKTIGFIIIWLNITLIKQRRLRWVYVRNKNFNMFLLEHWKNSDYFILSVKASGSRAYCFQTLLKIEHIRKGWGAHLVGGIFCSQPLLPVLSLSIVIVSLFNISSLCLAQVI